MCVCACRDIVSFLYAMRMTSSSSDAWEPRAAIAHDWQPAARETDCRNLKYLSHAAKLYKYRTEHRDNWEFCDNCVSTRDKVSWSSTKSIKGSEGKANKAHAWIDINAWESMSCCPLSLSRTHSLQLHVHICMCICVCVCVCLYLCVCVCSILAPRLPVNLLLHLCGKCKSLNLDTQLSGQYTSCCSSCPPYPCPYNPPLISLRVCLNVALQS